MHEELAIQVRDVSKTYSLYGSQRDQFVDVLRLSRFGLRPRSAPTKFNALSNINLDVRRGQRLGIIGRNGAGKTTLLKLLCGNFKPTSGSVSVIGTVQALMSIGLGFHPEHTGRENVRASLLYNGLSQDEFTSATNDIIEFCELGEFFDQPFKTYSLGMQARLMFAAATAIHPDILIVDEVLGAGDAYFVAKSKARMQRLVESGCTMLLVSHSMSQVLALCETAVWIDQGKIRLRGDAFSVVKAYEEFMNNSVGEERSLAATQASHQLDPDKSDLIDREETSPQITQRSEINLDQSLASPSQGAPSLAGSEWSPLKRGQFDFVAPGGVSRWESSPGPKVCGFTIKTQSRKSNAVEILRPLEFHILIESESTAEYSCRYGLLISDIEGRSASIIYSPPDRFSLCNDETRHVTLGIDHMLLGLGDYVIGISVLDSTDLEFVNTATRYDLLGRSFLLSVTVPETLRPTTGHFVHPGRWKFSSLSDAI